MMDQMIDAHKIRLMCNNLYFSANYNVYLPWFFVLY